MDKKILLKAVKAIVEKEVDRRVNERMKSIRIQILKELKKEISPMLKEVSESVEKTEENVDPFEHATQLLEDERGGYIEDNRTNKSQQSKDSKTKRLSKNPVLNEILSNTKPFSSEERQVGEAGSKSILDNLPMNASQEINEDINYNDYDEWETMKTPKNLGSVSSFKEEMTKKFGGSGGATPNEGGLGVKTGLSGLDKILNRDNSELVKRFNKKG